MIQFINYFEKFISHSLFILLWKSARKYRHYILNRFSQTERDSAWQLLQALPSVEPLEIRLKILGQLLEELYHADLFESLVQKEPVSNNPDFQGQRNKLFSKKQGPWRCFVYFLEGENSALKRLNELVKWGSQDVNLNRILKNIIADESGHCSVAKTYLINCGKLPEEINAEIQDIRQRRAQNYLKKIMALVAYPLTYLFMFIAYVTLGIFSFYLCQKAMRLNKKYQPKCLKQPIETLIFRMPT